MSADHRITTIEILCAEQERTIAELSAEVARQWQVIEKLEKTVEEMARRLVEVEDGGAPVAPATRPPHW